MKKEKETHEIDEVDIQNISFLSVFQLILLMWSFKSINNRYLSHAKRNHVTTVSSHNI